jgi:hypothetical protein
VSNIIEEIISRAADRAIDKAGDPAWVDSAVVQGRTRGVPLLPHEFQAPAGEFLDTIAANRDAVASAGRYTFTAIMYHMAIGRVDDARLLCLRSGSTAAERRAARDGADAAMAQEKIERDKTWETVRRVAEKGLQLGKVALPFILSVI